MSERQNRTIICSVLFLDLVEYSRRPVAEQLTLKERFNLLLREALKAVAPNDRIVLDTGDGAAVTFLGDPEDALFMALALRDAIQAQQEPNGLLLRSGINLGPVKLVKDVNGRPNIIGDGINVAQRIMGFAAPGQVLASRSYYEVVTRLSDDYAQLFSDEGSRTDKHVREHQVYGLSARHPVPRRSFPAAPGRLAVLADAVLGPLRARPRVAATFLAGAILLLGGVVRAHREPPPVPVAEPPAAAPATVLPLATGTVEAPAPSPALSLASAPTLEVKTAAAAKPEEKAAEKPASQPAQAAAKKTAPKRPPPGEGKVAEADPLVPVALAVLPWGEVYVDGKQQGVTPPIRSLHLAPGRHQIEFRNTSFPSHVEVIDVKPGEKITLRHKFQEATK